MVKWLLAHEANPLAQDQNGKTPVDFAKKQGNNDTEKILLDFIQVVQDEQVALANNDIEKLRELLLNDYRQYSVLHMVAQNGNAQVTESEINAGADVNAKTVSDVTPLHKATINDEIATATLLIENGANIDAVDLWNNPPIYYAVLRDNPEMVQLFLNAGANTDFRSALGDETILEYAERKGNVEIIQMMLDQ
jgi:ankyrin repeat protein